MDRITATQKSLTAFACGLVGLIPVFGLLPSIEALLLWRRLRRNYPGWNPAAAYLKYGAVLGAFGLLNSLLALAVIILVIADKLIG